MRWIILLLLLLPLVSGAEELTNVTLSARGDWYYGAENILIINTYSANLSSFDVNSTILNYSRMKNIVFVQELIEHKDVGLYYLPLFIELPDNDGPRILNIGVVVTEGGVVIEETINITVQKKNILHGVTSSIDKKIDDFKDRLEDDTVDTAVNTVIILLLGIFIIGVIIIITLRAMK